MGGPLTFSQQYLRAIQSDYVAQYHSQLLQQLQKMLGTPKRSNSATAVLEWPTVGGLVVFKQSLLQDDQAALLWLEKSLLQQP